MTIDYYPEAHARIPDFYVVKRGYCALDQRLRTQIQVQYTPLLFSTRIAICYWNTATACFTYNHQPTVPRNSLISVGTNSTSKMPLTSHMSKFSSVKSSGILCEKLINRWNNVRFGILTNSLRVGIRSTG